MQARFSQQLYKSADAGNVDGVIEALDHGADINYILRDRTSLVTAAFHGRTEVVRILLARGANPNLGVNRSYDKNVNGTTALQAAIQNNHSEIAKLLILSGSSANTARADGATALHLAAYYGREDIVKLLLQHGADSTIMSSHSCALFDAVGQGHAACAELLVTDLLKRFDQDPQQLLTFLLAQHDLKESLKFAVNSQFFFPQLLKLIQFMIVNKVDASKLAELMPLPSEITNKHYLKDITKHFSSMPLIQRESAYLNLLRDTHHPLKKLLPLEFLAIIRKKHTTDKNTLGSIESGSIVGLCLAAECNDDLNVRLAKEMVQGSPSLIFYGDRHDNWALFVAAAHGCDKMVETLLQAGASPDRSVTKGWAHYGKSPLHIACENGHVKIVQAFLKHHLRDLLIRRWADGTNTPLSAAIKAGQIEVVRVFIKNNAVMYLPSSSNPLDTALDNKQYDIFDLLINHMLNSSSIYTITEILKSINLSEFLKRVMTTHEQAFSSFIKLLDHLVENGISHQQIIERLGNVDFKMSFKYIDFKNILFNQANYLSLEDRIKYDDELLNPYTYKGFLMQAKIGLMPNKELNDYLARIAARKQENENKLRQIQAEQKAAAPVAAAVPESVVVDAVPAPAPVTAPPPALVAEPVAVPAQAEQPAPVAAPVLTTPFDDWINDDYSILPSKFPQPAVNELDEHLKRDGLPLDFLDISSTKKILVDLMQFEFPDLISFDSKPYCNPFDEPVEETESPVIELAFSSSESNVLDHDDELNDKMAMEIFGNVKSETGPVDGAFLSRAGAFFDSIINREPVSLPHEDASDNIAKNR